LLFCFVVVVALLQLPSSFHSRDTPFNAATNFSSFLHCPQEFDRYDSSLPLRSLRFQPPTPTPGQSCCFSDGRSCRRRGSAGKTAAIVTALAAQAAAAVPIAHVAFKLPDFWVKDPKMWFSQAEAQFRRARITAETTMYDNVLMKLPEDVVMSVRALVSAIEADPVKQEGSYTFMKEALMGSYGKTKWQMA
jgi:hypothetical protein